MLQHAFASNFASVAVRQPFLSRPLEEIFRRVRMSFFEFNAQDIYQICTVALNMDTLGMIQDDEFMRGLSSAFDRCDQSVISPFQANLVADTFRRANIIATPKDIVLPEPDAVSPESLINVIRHMNVTKTRDERKLFDTLILMFPLLDEFSPSQLSLAITELSRIGCFDKQFMSRLARRAVQVSDDLNALDVSSITLSLATIDGIPRSVMVSVLDVVEQRVPEFLPDDYVNVLQALHRLGPTYQKSLSKLVEHALDKVESMDAVSLSYFVVCFAALEYRDRGHMEIFADALVGVAEDLSEKHLVQSLIALHRIGLLSASLFGALASLLLQFAAQMDARNIAPVMDICSQVPFNSDLLMRGLLDRCAELARTLSPIVLGEILDIIAEYPPAREHAVVQLMGKQARLRVDIMNPQALAGAVRGLGQLGYVDPEFYLAAAETFFRYSFKDFSRLEPILHGLCLGGNGPSVPRVAVKVLASHLAPMAHSMTLAQVERANRYMVQLGVEDEWVYRQLAMRVLNFVKEVTPDMPQDLQLLMQKGAAAMQPGM